MWRDAALMAVVLPHRRLGDARNSNSNTHNAVPPPGPTRQQILVLLFAVLFVATGIYVLVLNLALEPTVHSAENAAAAANAAAEAAVDAGGGHRNNNVAHAEARRHFPRFSGPDFLTSVCGAAHNYNPTSHNHVEDRRHLTTRRRGSALPIANSTQFARIQQLIYDSQHPPTCSEQNTMQWVGAFEGFTAIGIGGQLSTLSLALGLAVVRGKVLVVADNSSQLTNCPQR